MLAATALVGVLAATGCAEESAAVRVGDRNLSDKDLMDEVATLYDNTAFWELIDQGAGEPAGTSRDVRRGEAPGSYTQAFVAEVIQQRVTLMLLEELFEEEGGEVTAEHRSQATEAQSQNFGPAFSEFPQSYQDDLIEVYSHVASLQESLGPDGFDEAFAEIIDETDVEVSPRYGRWDNDIFRNAPQQSPIAPPEGPLPAPGEDAGVEGLGDVGTAG